MSRVNADLSFPATVDTGALPWEPSPAWGVFRKRIERSGGEVSRLTSLVKYDPNTSFPAHTHGGGEEYLVLDGVFSDKKNRHPAGTYVRNGVGTSHKPLTMPGAVIFVKLWWMHPDDTASSIQSTGDDAPWQSTPNGGTLSLFDGPHETTWMQRVSGSLQFDYRGGVEIFVVKGALSAVLEHGWLRRPGRGTFKTQAATDTLLYIKTGHLANPPALPPQPKPEPKRRTW